MLSTLDLVIYATIATPILLLVALLIALAAGSRLLSVQRQQVTELARLRSAVVELGVRRPGAFPADEPEPDAGGLPRIGTEERVFQTGDSVEIIDGVHRGDFGTIAPTPDWLRPGFVCVELTGGRGPRYLAAAKLVRVDGRA